MSPTRACSRSVLLGDPITVNHPTTFDSKNSGGDATDEPGDFCVVPCVPYPSDFTTSVAGKKQQLKKEQ